MAMKKAKAAAVSEPATLSEALFGEDPALRASFDANAEKRDLALALRRVRRWAGLTQSEVAGRSGLKQSHVSKIESATGPMPTTETLRKFAAACRARVRIDFIPEPEAHKKAVSPAGDGLIAAAMV